MLCDAPEHRLAAARALFRGQPDPSDELSTVPKLPRIPDRAAWLRLVPRQHSSGGKPTLLDISKRGDRYLRTLLVHGARSVIVRVLKRDDEKGAAGSRGSWSG